MRSFIRRRIERWPLLAAMYRSCRDLWRLFHDRPAMTPGGFSIMGNPLMQAGTFEPTESAVFKKALKGAACVVDVGANIGFYSLLSHRVAELVIAVEPLHENLEYLFRNIDANAAKNIEVFPFGLSTSFGHAKLYGASTGASLVSGWADSSDIQCRFIALAPFDAIITDRIGGRQALIKIDVEGAEHDVLLGASRAGDLDPAPHWMIEISYSCLHPHGVHPHYEEVFGWFFSRKYMCYDIERKRPIGAAEVQQVTVENPRNYCGNYLFTKDEALMKELSGAQH